MNESPTLRKNPSRETCEGIIKRILITEVLEHGRNKHFKGASDFMNYFESLYPASDALTKQVQRAIKAMDMPKDEHGFLIVNKTTDQFEKEISSGRPMSQSIRWNRLRPSFYLLPRMHGRISSICWRLRNSFAINILPLSRLQTDC